MDICISNYIKNYLKAAVVYLSPIKYSRSHIQCYSSSVYKFTAISIIHLPVLCTIIYILRTQIRIVHITCDQALPPQKPHKLSKCLKYPPH